MIKYRLQILYALAFGLAGLLWLDNASTESSGSNRLSMFTNSNSETSKKTQELLTEYTIMDNGSSKRFAVSNENPLSFLSVDILRETVDRPLFVSNRRPIKKLRKVIKASASVAAPQIKRNTYTLLGIIRSQDRSIALLSGEKNGLNFRVETGDLIGGWYVKRVKAKQIILEQNLEQVVLSIP